jgi:hypothetical protein
MDDLVLTGTAALLGFYTAAVICVAGILIFLFTLWNAIISGNSGVVLLLTLSVALVGFVYAASGCYLHSTGRI